MLEPPSDRLLKLLLELNLCSQADLRRAKGAVRRLTYDLPAFDSVWLDALAQLGKLTRFQVQLLESTEPERISLGPCVFAERLGGGPLGETFLARSRTTDDVCVVKVLTASEQLEAAGAARLTAWVERARDLKHPTLVTPQTWDRVDGKFVIVSRYVDGPHLGELLVRRGRYPAGVVWEMGRQLLDGLVALEQRGLVHGDIRIANVRLSDGGWVVLVDAGIRANLDPELTVHVGLPPDRYDGVAPELIGTGRAPQATSDLYALGCLLWQLLAGRPPYPGGDPLGKLAAHQTRRIDDVRKWAPDTPPLLAETLRQWTSPNPADRPATFAAAQTAWGAPRRSGRRLLSSFRRQFDTPVPQILRGSGWSPLLRWTCVCLVLLVMSGLAVNLAEQGASSSPLAIGSRWAEPGAWIEWGQHCWELGRHYLTRAGSVAESSATAGPTASSGPGPTSAAVAPASTNTIAQRPARAEPRSSAALLPLPPPNPDGVILLNQPGPYAAAEVTAVGVLQIRGERHVHPEIVIRDRPLKLWADTVRLDNIRLQYEPPSVDRTAERIADRAAGQEPLPSAPAALVLIHAHSLVVDHCTFSSPCAALDAASSNPHAMRSATFKTVSSESASSVVEGPTQLAWKLLSPPDPRGGQGVISHSVFLGDAPALYLASPVRSLQQRHCLKIGQGPWCTLGTVPAAGKTLHWTWSNLTCRDSGAVLRWIVTSAPPRPGRLQLDTHDCVFDPHRDQASLLEFVSTQEPGGWSDLLRWQGDGSLVRSVENWVVWRDAATAASHPLDALRLSAEGLSSGQFEFAAPVQRDPLASELQSFQAPRRSSTAPGILAEKLPAP